MVIAESSASIAGVMTVAHHDKLDGIETGATADQTKSDINGLAITTVGALSSGTVASGFGNIDNGSSTLDTGAATVASLACTAAATFGGGFGSTGATISTAGVGQFNGALTTSAALTGESLVVNNITVDANTVSTTDNNGNLLLAANGTGKIEVRGNDESGAIILNCQENSHGVTIQAPAHNAFDGDYTLTLPINDGNDGQVLKTDGDGVLAWVNAGGTPTSLGTVTQDTVVFTSANANDPLVQIKNTTNDVNGARLQFVKDKGAAGADGDDIGIIEFVGDDTAQTQTTFAKIVAEVSESADSDEAGKLSFFVAESNGTTTDLAAGLVLEGEHTTDGEVDVTIAAGAASTTTIAGTLTMGSTAAMTNAGLLSVANQSNITGLGTISSGVWNGTVVASDYLDADTAHLTTAQTFTGVKTIGTNVKLQFRDSGSYINSPDANDLEIVGADITLDASNVIELEANTNVTGNLTVSGSVTHDYNTSTFENQLADDVGSGKIIKYSPGADDTLVGSQIYFLHTDGTWNSADADAIATGGTQMLGVGLQGSARTVGVFIEGFIRIASTEILNTPGSGAVDGLPLYVSTTAGHFDFTPPSGSGDFVRIVGYAIDDHSGSVLVNFSPSKDNIVLA